MVSWGFMPPQRISLILPFTHGNKWHGISFGSRHSFLEYWASYAAPAPYRSAECPYLQPVFEIPNSSELRTPLVFHVSEFQRNMQKICMAHFPKNRRRQKYDNISIPKTPFDSRIYLVYTTGMTTQIRKWGNSLAIRIARDVADDFELEEGSFVEIVSAPSEIIVRPTHGARKYTLDSLVRDIRKENLHKEADWGKPRGKEIW